MSYISKEQIEGLVASAVLEEREACVKIVKLCPNPTYSPALSLALEHTAKRIRNRSNQGFLS